MSYGGCEHSEACVVCCNADLYQRARIIALEDVLMAAEDLIDRMEPGLDTWVDKWVKSLETAIDEAKRCV